MYAARRETISPLNWSGTATVHASSHCRQPVHNAASTKLGLRSTVAWKPPSPSRTISSTSELVSTVTLG